MRRARSIPLLLLVLLWASLSPARAVGHQVTLDPKAGLAGTVADVIGSGFLPPGPVSIHWDSKDDKAIASTESNQNGAFSVDITIPADAAPGDHDVFACDVQQVCVDATFTVTSPTPPPPTPEPTPKPTPKPAPTPGSTPTPAPTESPGSSPSATPPGGIPVPSGPITAPPSTGSLLVGSDVGIGLIGDGILGDHATIQVPGLEPQPEGFQPRCEPPPQATIVDFDDVPAGTDLREQYSDLGVHIEAGGLSETRIFTPRPGPLVPYDATAPGTISMPNAIEVADIPEERHVRESLRVRFDTPQRLIGIYVGSPSAFHQQVRMGIPGRDSDLSPDPTRDAVYFDGPSTITNCLLLVLPADQATTEVLVTSSYTDQGLYADRLFFSDDPTYSLPELVEGVVTLRSPGRASEVEVSAPITLTGSAGPVLRPGDTALRRVERVLVTYVNGVGSTVNRYAEVVVPVPPMTRSEWRLEGVSLPTGPIRISMFASGTGVVARGTSDFTGFTLEDLRRDAEGSFDLQPMGIEVTQGIRGPIGLQLAGTIARETAVHVANKATTVRAYGRVVWGGDGPAPGVDSFPTDAWLLGFSRGRLLPGSPLRALPAEIDLVVRGSPMTELQAMRAEASSTWNFDLPLSWTAAGSIDLMLWINPPGAGHWREGFGSDRNDLWLRGVRFSAIDPREVVIYAADFHWRNDGPLQRALPTLGEIAASLDYWERAFPIPYGGLTLTEFHVKRWALRACSDLEDPLADTCSRPPVDGIPTWQNSVIVAEQAERVTRPGELFIPLLFSPASPIGCSGRASIGGSPLFHAGACGATVSQEAAHSLGLIHVSNAHAEELPARSRYVDDHGELETGAMGWDVARRQPIPPGSSSDAHVHDFMSYGGGTVWVSIDTWERVAAALMARNASSPRDAPAITPGRIAPASASGPEAKLAAWISTLGPPWGDMRPVADVAETASSLLVSGILDAEGAVSEVRLIAVNAPPADPAAHGDIEIALLGADGTELHRRHAGSLHDTHGGLPGEFHVFVPALADAATVLVRGGSGDVVTVAIGEATTLDDLNQPDADPGLQPLIRTPSGLGILSPRGSLRFDAVVPGEDGGLTYAWLLDGETVSDGSSVFIANLGVGRHVLELRVASGARSGSSSVPIVVDEDTDQDGLGNAWETSVGLDPEDADDPQADTDADGLPLWLEQALGGDPRMPDTDGDGYADGIERDGGSDPADAASVPMALHGALGEPVPRLDAGPVDGLQPALPLLAAGAAALLALAGLLAWLFLRRRAAGP